MKIRDIKFFSLNIIMSFVEDNSDIGSILNTCCIYGFYPKMINHFSFISHDVCHF